MQPNDSFHNMTCGNKITPIFIIGVPRSGTTLLRVLLDSHTRMAAAPETPWILGGYGRYSLRDIAVYLTEDKLGPTKNLPGEDEEVIMDGLRMMLDRIFSAYLAKKQKNILVLKTPDDIRYLDFLLRLYPQSTYIHIFRDGRDVACSTVKKKGVFFGDKLTDYGELNYENTMRRWYEWEKRIRNAFGGPGKPSYISISYEELVLKPEQTLIKVCSLIGVPYEKGILDYSKFEHEYPEWEAGSTDVKSKNHIDATSIGRWKKEISRTELIRLEAKYCDLLEELGYKLDSNAEERITAVKEETALNELQHSLQIKNEHLREKDEALKQKDIQLEQERIRIRDLEERIKEIEREFQQKCEELIDDDNKFREKDKRLLYKRDLLKQKDEILRQQNDQLLLKDNQLKQLNEHLKLKDDQLMQKDELLRQQNDQLQRKDENIGRLNEQIRQKDEYLKNQLSEANDRLKVKDDQLIQKDELLKQQSDQIRLSDEQIRQKDEYWTDQLRQLSEHLRLKDEQLIQKDEQLANGVNKTKEMEEQLLRHEEQSRKNAEELRKVESILGTRSAELATREQELVTLQKERISEKQKLEEELRQKNRDIYDLLHSLSWRVTKPLRILGGLLRKN